jgi:uncharacterized protein (DUF433 family)
VDGDDRCGDRARAGAPGPGPGGSAHGAGTRIFLDVLVAHFKRGRTPESIHEAYDRVPLADVYAIFAYYLHHRLRG